MRPVENCGSVGAQLHSDWSPAALGLEPSCTPTRTLLCKPYLITLPALELDAVDNGAAAKRFCEEQRFLVCFAKMDR
jgi:hypothetical protein